jgi:hypothetical protein
VQGERWTPELKELHRLSPAQARLSLDGLCPNRPSHVHPHAHTHVGSHTHPHLHGGRGGRGGGDDEWWIVRDDEYVRA